MKNISGSTKPRLDVALDIHEVNKIFYKTGQLLNPLLSQSNFYPVFHHSEFDEQ